MNNKEVLRKIAASSRFEMSVFDGAIILQGRILSPSESENAGLLTYLLASQITTKQDLERMQHIRAQAEKIEEDSQASEIDQLLFEARKLGFSPDALAAFHGQQNKIICQVVKAASTDNGKTFEPITLVLEEGKQDPDKSILWIGVFTNEDRAALLEKAMSGHKDAAKRIAAFCNGRP